MKDEPLLLSFPKGPIGAQGPRGPRGFTGLRGEPGPPGKDGRDGKDGAPGRDGEPGTAGPPGRDGRDGKDGAPGRDGIDGKDGRDGREIELRTWDGYIQWRYVGTDEWFNLIHLDLLKGNNGLPGDPGPPGEPGTPIVLETGLDSINWRYSDDTAWNTLVPLADLQGPPGRDGVDGKDGEPGKDGTPGRDGIDGKSIELDVTATHIRWRQQDEVNWNNLIAIEDLRGPPGQDGKEAQLPRQIGFFIFMPPYHWTTEPGDYQLGGEESPAIWTADIGEAQGIRLAATCQDADKSAALAIEYSSDGMSWLGGVEKENWVILNPGKPVVSPWFEIQDPEAQFFRLLLVDIDNLEVGAPFATITTISVEVINQPP